MILVFGSGKDNGIAIAAREVFGANDAPGKSGFCYSIPVKSHGMLLPIEEIARHAADFVRYAKETPSMEFYMTRVGCEPGEYQDSQIAPLFADVPSNVILPGIWLNIINIIKREPCVTRVIVTGARDFNNPELVRAKMDYYLGKLNLESVEIVSGGETGGDMLGGLYAKERGIKLTSPQYKIEKFGRQAGYKFCNQLWSMYATHMVVFHDGNNPVMQHLIDTVEKDGERVVVIPV